MDFQTFHQNHPEVYTELARLAREARSAGFQRFGIRTLWERMRWTFLIERQGEFRFNDHLTAQYARLIMNRETDLAGLFEIRHSSKGGL
jgi:hypothetical protein